MPSFIELYPRLKAYPGKEIGVEIEVEGSNLPEKVKGWTATRDGSLRGNSMEYILTAPIKAENFPKAREQLQLTMKEVGSKMKLSDRCGVHVHINCQELTVQQIYCFLVLYFIFEDLLTSYCGTEREGNLFCLRAKDADALLTKLAACAMENSFDRIFSDSYRYAAVNVTALAKFGSLEFRTLRTPDDFSEIDKWVDVLMHLKNKALTFKEPKQIIEKLSEMGANAFARSVLGKHTSMFNMQDVSTMLMQGMRRAQEIAYSWKFVEYAVPAKKTIHEINIGLGDVRFPVPRTPPTVPHNNTDGETVNNPRNEHVERNQIFMDRNSGRWVWNNPPQEVLDRQILEQQQAQQAIEMQRAVIRTRNEQRATAIDIPITDRPNNSGLANPWNTLSIPLVWNDQFGVPKPTAYYSTNFETLTNNRRREGWDTLFIYVVSNGQVFDHNTERERWELIDRWGS